MQRLIVTENLKDIKLEMEGVRVISPKDYIGSEVYSQERNIRVINLCKSYQYQSAGYYISLLAEARGHRVLPVTSTMMDFKLPKLAREDAQDFDNLIQEILEKANIGEKCEFNIYFGVTRETSLSKIGQLMFNLFQMPIQRVSFQKKDKWQLQLLKPLNFKELNAEERVELDKALQLFLLGKNIVRKSYKRKKFDLGILINPDDKTPPSDPAALQKFVKAAEKTGFNAEFITKADYGKITHYDAIFIRESTNVNHHTFRFARKAEYEGIAVIDDPNSILKCTNKVYIKELLEANNVPIPMSAIVLKNDPIKDIEGFKYPYVLKQPDGAFSQGVKKVSNHEEFKLCLTDFFETTDMVIAQEFMPTDFDWRVGVLDGKVIYVCKYFMARNHWQIVDWKSGKYNRFGKSETISNDQAPKKLLSLALKASKLIGNGLYGVDIKEFNKKFYVIEINDNPSIDSGVEDRIEKNKLYEGIMKHLLKLVLSE
ncbi:MAG: RimK family protein [Cyclobacteriaceae bacterium]|nr:RimK family protein [Cyclobacteriaceae bacterium]